MSDVYNTKRKTHSNYFHEEHEFIVIADRAWQMNIRSIGDDLLEETAD